MSSAQDQETFGITRFGGGESVLRSSLLVRRGLDLVDRQKPEHPEIAELRERANAGDVSAQCMLAIRYLGGDGVPQDTEKAVEWFRKAEEQVHARGEFTLGLAFSFAYAGHAGQGHADAQSELGFAYAAGNGVPQDDEQAVHWFRKAAEQGHAEAQTALGRAYAGDGGVPQDDEQAVYWFRKAAEQGEPQAQYDLGEAYASGRGVPQDHAQAVEWYRKAAGRGHHCAQYNLGAAYAAGRGVSRDYVEAHKWLNLAAARASSDSSRTWYAGHRDDLAKKMIRAQLSESQKRAREWLEAFEQHNQS